jgi:magnesium chelatase family protein
MGVDGQLVSVEVDLRNAIPGVDMVGLPDGAVRESRERVRVAIRNSGYRFPKKRVLVNLAPAAVRKAGASFDLAIALGVLAATGQVPANRLEGTLAVGELNLSGTVQAVPGVIAAVESGSRQGLRTFFVPTANAREAFSLNKGRIMPVDSLADAVEVVRGNETGACKDRKPPACPPAKTADQLDFADVRGHYQVKKAMELAAAGRHNTILLGPPGGGKTLCARCFPSILPPLTPQESLEVTRIHSLAGVLQPDSGLMTRRPVRTPHHLASSEGIIGGGRHVRPGEVSLAHRGVLLLDEALEYRIQLLQSLREPVEDGWVTIARAGFSARYPAAFQLLMTTNACPCGGAGMMDGKCVCSEDEVHRYWKRLGYSLLDRIDLRIPIQPIQTEVMLGPPGVSSRALKRRVLRAFRIQQRRYRGLPFRWNAQIPAGRVQEFCAIPGALRKYLLEEAEHLGLSSRGTHSVLKVARTAADLDGRADIELGDLQIAILNRQNGEKGIIWPSN